MADPVQIIVDVFTILLIIVLILVCFYGQNWQGWYAGRQIIKAIKELEIWREEGVDKIQEIIKPICPNTVSSHEINGFIREMLEFFVIAPSPLDPPVFNKLLFLNCRRETRFRELIKEFLPNIDNISLSTITSLLQATTEIEQIYRNVKHNLIIGKKTKSTWILMQTSADIIKTMMNAKAYSVALESFVLGKPIGDSLGPLAIKEFIAEIHGLNGTTLPDHQLVDGAFFGSTFDYEGRQCICLRAKGPASVVGNPGTALNILLESLQKEQKSVQLIITIDAMQRLEGEKSGTVAIGLGAAIGGGSTHEIDKYCIESLAMCQNSPIPIESIICKQSLEDAVAPMSEEIYRSIPKIIRYLKRIVRSQTKEGDIVIILGIGNALGVEIE